MILDTVRKLAAEKAASLNHCVGGCFVAVVDEHYIESCSTWTVDCSVKVQVNGLPSL